MTGKQALRALIEAVEAGEWRSEISTVIFSRHHHMDVYRAFNGSLDAAKALYEALLPGWWFAIQPTGATVGKMDHPHDGCIFDGGGKIPARAWLIAILKAYEAHL